MDLKMNKSWQWLFYLDLVLPGMLFLLALLLGTTSFGSLFARLFHSYGLYIIDPIPGGGLTGLAGIALHGTALVLAAKRREWLDFGLCVLLLAGTALFFGLEWNYQAIRILKFIP